MNKTFSRPVFYGLVIFFVVALLASAAACKSTPNPELSPTPISTAPSTSTPAATPFPSPAQSPSPTSSVASPSISTTSLPAGVIGTAYSQTLQASGGVGAHTWGISSGSLPMGLVLDPKSGIISGTPASAASYFFTALVIDSAGVSNNQALLITINLSRSLASAIIVATNSLPPGTVGTSYSQVLRSVSGNGSITWSIPSSSLPTGLTLDAKTGTISGTPTAAGTSNFFVEAADNSGSNAIQSLSLTINSSSSPAATPSSAAPPTGLTITTSSFPAGIVGTNYSQSLKVINGSTPFSWSYLRGSLPAGLFLDAQLGIISGTPATAGTAYFLIQVTDSASATNTQSLSITIN